MRASGNSNPFAMQNSSRMPQNHVPPHYHGGRFIPPHNMPSFNPQYPPRFPTRFLGQQQHNPFTNIPPPQNNNSRNGFQDEGLSFDAPCVNPSKIPNSEDNVPRTGTIIGDIRAGMAAAAFSAATAVQRAQLMLQEKQKVQPESDLSNDDINKSRGINNNDIKSLSDNAEGEISGIHPGGIEPLEAQLTETDDLLTRKSSQKGVDKSSILRSLDDEKFLKDGLNTNQSNPSNKHGQCALQNTVGDASESASCETLESSQPITEVEGVQGGKSDQNKEEQRASSFFEYGSLVEGEEVEMLDKQTLASKKLEDCSSSKSLNCANELEKERTNNGDLRGEEPEKEGNLLLEEQGLQPRLTRSNLRNQRRAINRTSSSNLVQVNSSGSIDDDAASLTEVEGIDVEEVRGLNKEGVRLGGEMDVRYKEGAKEIKEMTQHKVIQEGALSNLFENDAVQKDLTDKLDVADEEDENDDGRGKIRKQLHQESEKEGCFTDTYQSSNSYSATEKQQLQNTKIDCLSVTTSISQHSQALHTSSTLLTSASSTSGCYATSDLNAGRTTSSPSSQSLGGITSNGLDARDIYQTEVNEDNKKIHHANSPNLISSSTNNNRQKENSNSNYSVCNNNSDTNKDSNHGVDCASSVNGKKSTVENYQGTITSSHLVLPDTTTNILADTSNTIPNNQTKEYQNSWQNFYNQYPNKANGQITPTNNPSNTNNNFLREFLHGKLALAAAVAQRQQFNHSDYQQRFQRNFFANHPPHRGTFPQHIRSPNFLPPQSVPISPQGIPYPYPPNQFGAIHPLHVNRFLQHSSALRNNLSRMMEPALLSSGGVPRDFSATRHNNNDLKESAAVAANLMQRIKMIQEMQAANGSNISDDSPRSDENEDTNKLTDAEDEPIDLQRNTNDGRSSVQSSDGELLGRASPRSPSSDAGMSSSSGKDPTKSSRLEQIALSLRNSSPLPGSNSSQNGSVVNGCKKRKLYQPVQHEKSPSSTSDKLCSSPFDEGRNDENEMEDDDDIIEEQQLHHDELHQPESKKKRTYVKHNDENADPSTETNSSGIVDEQNENCPMPPIRQRAKQVRDSTKIHNKDRITPLPSAIPPPSQATQLPLPHGGHMPMNPLQLHMEMAKHFRQMQEQQDKIAKEAITKEIINETINKNHLIDGKLAAQIAAANCPEMHELTGLLKTEITASLDAVMTPIIENIVGRFLQARRTPLGSRPFALDDSSATISSARNAFLGNNNSPSIPHLPPPPTLKQHIHSKSSASGRAPQVRDRAGPRINGNASLAMENQLSAISQSISQSIFSPSMSNSHSGGSHTLPLPPSLRPAPTMSVNSDKTPSIHDDDSDSGAMPEQDEALSLVVTPKKKRHKVTDTRITPRTMSRVLGNESNIMSDLHKQLSSANLPFPPPLSGLKTPRSEAGTINNLSPRLPIGTASSGGAAPPPPIIPGFPGVPGFMPPLPTSVAIPNPSLADFNPFSSFYSPPLPKNLAADVSKFSGDDLGFARSRTPGSPPRDHRDHRERRRSAGMDRDSPATLLSRPSLLNSPDFTSFSKSGDSEKGSSNDQEEFDRVQSSLQQFSGKSK